MKTNQDGNDSLSILDFFIGAGRLLATVVAVWFVKKKEIRTIIHQRLIRGRRIRPGFPKVSGVCV